MAGQTAVHRFSTNHPTADGHFPDNPIIPGAVLLQAVIRAIGGRCVAVPSVKFLSPVRPGDDLEISWDVAETGEIRFTAGIGGRRAVAGQLRLEAN